MNAMEYVLAQGRITNGVYQKINNTTCDVAKYELKSLVDKKKLKMVGEKKGAVYVSA
jgi:predicted HTH transcriptional regulator